MLGQARAAPRAPGQGQVTLIEIPALVTLLEEGPDSGDVAVVVRVVGMLPVHPLPESDRLVGDHLGVGIHSFAAGLRELRQAERLDIRLAPEPEGTLDLDFHPQSLAVVAVLVAAALVVHRVEADERIFERPTPCVVNAHGIVGGNRPVQEAELRLTSALLAQLVERVGPLPVREHALLDVERAVLGVNRARRAGFHWLPRVLLMLV